MIATSNDAILSSYQPYIVATAEHLALADPAPFGIKTEWHFDPTRTSSAVFCDLLQRLDALTFGPEGMPMDKWVFYDCAELPGFIYGFAVPAAQLSAHERELFGLTDDYDGAVPVSMYIAIPMHERGTWFGHNLASLNRTLPDRDLHHLGTITKAIALKAFRVERFVGATQWLSNALYIHTKFGPLELQTAYTPAHSIHETLTYAFDVTDDSLRAAAGDPTVTLIRPEPTMRLDASDVDAMRELQSHIEAGAQCVLVGPPSQQGEHRSHPIALLS